MRKRLPVPCKNKDVREDSEANAFTKGNCELDFIIGGGHFELALLQVSLAFESHPSLSVTMMDNLKNALGRNVKSAGEVSQSFPSFKSGANDFISVLSDLRQNSTMTEEPLRAVRQ